MAKRNFEAFTAKQQHAGVAVKTFDLFFEDANFNPEKLVQLLASRKSADMFASGST